MDQMVKDVQIWLNENYTGKIGFTPLTPDGVTGNATFKGLIVALQHEIGIASPNGNFGAGTIAACPVIEPGITNSKLIRIVQGGLYCKGYQPNGFDGGYGNGLKRAINQFKENAGFDSDDGIMDAMFMKALLNTDAFVLVSVGRTTIQMMQRELNRNYSQYYWKSIGLIPCDGVYGRNTNKALIYAFQVIAGVSADGIIGNGTLSKAPTLTISSRNEAVRILKYAMACNGYNFATFTTTYDDDLRDKVRAFQLFVRLEIDNQVVLGEVNRRTWAALLVSKGDPERKANACDCATQLDRVKAVALKAAGYEYVGRYLTGFVGSGTNRKPKALTAEELSSIFSAGLKIFAIFQDGTPSVGYFTYNKGLSDGIKAIEAALALGLPANSIIYFAVDYDMTDAQVTSNVEKYFKGVNDARINYRRVYRIGIYGSRNVCRRILDRGYASSCFLCDMSTGFSGNQGYLMPEEWAFDQFHEFTFTYSSGSFPLDKDTASIYAEGISNVAVLDYPQYTIPLPEELQEEHSSLSEFISFVEQLETACGTYIGESNPSDARRPIIQEILFALKYYNYNDALWSAVLGGDNDKFQKHLERNYPELLSNLMPYISGVNPKLFSDGNGGVLDIAHLAATTIAYAYGGSLMDEPWTGWAGDLISVMKNVKTHIEVHQGDDPQMAADAFLGTKPYNFNYADICTDADAIKIAEMIKSADSNNSHVFSEILNNYYQNHVQNRMMFYLQDMMVSETSVSDIYEYLDNYMSKIPQQAATIFLNNTIISGEIQQACWRAFAKYIYASITEH